MSWRSACRLATALAIAALAAGVIWRLGVPIALLVVAISAAAALNPIVDAIERRLSRALAIALVYAGVGCAVALLNWLLGSTVAREAQDLSTRLPQLIDRAQSWQQHIEQSTGFQLQTGISSILRSGTNRLVEIPLAVSTAIGEVLVIFFLSIYWLIEMPAARRFALAMCPDRYRVECDRIFGELGDAMGGYFRGAAINGVILGTAAAVTLWCLGVPFPIVLSLITAVGELVPYLGALISGVVAVSAALLRSPATALWTLAFYVALQQLEGHVLSPNIMRTQTHAPAGVVLFGFTAGFAAGGIVGGIAGIPLAAAARVLLIHATSGAR